MTDRLDAALDALANSHRRRILCVLSAHVDDGAEGPLDHHALAGDETELAVLVHQHLPKLAARDYIEWDHEAGSIRPGECFEEIQPVVTLLAEHTGALPGQWL